MTALDTIKLFETKGIVFKIESQRRFYPGVSFRSWEIEDIDAENEEFDDVVIGGLIDSISHIPIWEQIEYDTKKEFLDILFDEKTLQYLLDNKYTLHVRVEGYYGSPETEVLIEEGIIQEGTVSPYGENYDS